MTLRSNRPIELSAANCFRSLMERHNFIVQEIDGKNDHGEDFYLSFTENGERTGDTIAIQTKGGVSHRTRSGYRVRIRRHLEFWYNSNTPVYCIVQDPDSQELFWANASAQIRAARKAGKKISSIQVDTANKLSDETVLNFALRARLYISETGDFHRFLTRLSSVAFAPSDYLAYFENVYGERMIFRQVDGEPTATLLHSDLEWHPVRVVDDDIALNKTPRFFRRAPAGPAFLPLEDENATLKDVVLSRSERMWIEACFEESQRVRTSGDDHPKPGDFATPRIPPILYSPLDELKVAHYSWRSDANVNDLMERLIELSYLYWDDQPIGHPHRPKSPGEREAIWSELKNIVQQLKGLKVPGYYLMGNRGRLTRSDMEQLFL